jgi:ElaB/YqjD/DUF883 family membrane-anchored ribosome-binding protein
MKPLALVTTATAVALLLGGCAGFRTERQGRDVGRAICRVKHAGSPDQAQRALDTLRRDLEQAQRITGRPVDQDVHDIQSNMNDLVQHVSSRQSTLARQDVAAIQRNVEDVIRTAPGLTKRFYEGVNEGLGDCT